MKTISNECGSRNNFGFYDTRAKEIVLTRPCTKKADINEVYVWLEDANELRKLSIGIGPVENFVADNTAKRPVCSCTQHYQTEYYPEYGC